MSFAKEVEGGKFSKIKTLSAKDTLNLDFLALPEAEFANFSMHCKYYEESGSYRFVCSLTT